MRKVRVDLPLYGYDIKIGEKASEALGDIRERFCLGRRALVISDRHIAPLYGEQILHLLRKNGMEAKLAVIEAGERSKCLEAAETLYTAAIEMGLDRKSAVVALGGGVVGDLAGFIAATYMRGVPFFQVPTSLLAQVDSSVGGKVAVNHALGKNLIGAFYQPKEVLIDLAMSATLPPREISTGLGEIIKYGVIADEEFFLYLEEHTVEALRLDRGALVHLIARSCEIKADIVARDEKEASLRMILNFGHTIAHAIESQTHYAVYNHGEAVAIGMHGAALISCALGMIASPVVERIKHLIAAMRLPLYAEKCAADALYDALFHDKKVVDGKLKWVLIDRIGHAVIRGDVPQDIVRHALAEVAAAK